MDSLAATRALYVRTLHRLHHFPLGVQVTERLVMSIRLLMGNAQLEGLAPSTCPVVEVNHGAGVCTCAALEALTGCQCNSWAPVREGSQAANIIKYEHL